MLVSGSVLVSTGKYGERQPCSKVLNPGRNKWDTVEQGRATAQHMSVVSVSNLARLD